MVSGQLPAAPTLNTSNGFHSRKAHEQPQNHNHVAAARVLLAIDCPLVRDGLAAQISRCPDLCICGEADGRSAALQLIADSQPDAVVVDVLLEGGSGIELVKRIHERFPSVRVLVWSIFSDGFYAERVLKAGALGYITREQTAETVIEAIRRALGGNIFMSKPLADDFLERVVSNRTKDRTPLETLSNRELEVFQYIGQGQNTLAISKQMQVSRKTVETYRARLKTKLNLKNSYELVRSAVLQCVLRQ